MGLSLPEIFTLQKKLVKTVFEIEAAEAGDQSANLYMQIGSDHCLYAFLNDGDNKIQKLVYKELDATHFNAGELLAGLDEHNINKTVVASAFPQALLVPQRYFRENDSSYLDVLYDLPAQKYLHDRINEWQVVTVYSMPQLIFDSLNSRFSNVQFFHSYTAAIKAGHHSAQPHLMVNFTSENFSVLLKNNQQLQLLQTYSYKTPLDVVYYLLKICYEFSIPQTEVQLLVSGFLEKNSALFTELRNYFLNVDFEPAPEGHLPAGEYPHHYFTALYNLLLCAS